MGDQKNNKNRKYGVKKTPTVIQIEAVECGAACLSIILQYYKKYVSPEELRESVAVSRDGSKAGNIMRAAEKYNMEVHGYRRETYQLKNMKPPFIMHWNFNHFVVFEGIRGNKVYINDPAFGRRIVSYKELDDSFTGICIVCTPNKGFEKAKKKDGLRTMVLKIFKENKSAIAALLVTGILLTIPPLIYTLIAKYYLDVVLKTFYTTILPQILLFMFCVLVFSVIFRIMRNRLLRGITNKMALQSSNELLSHMFRLPMSFYEMRFAGDVSTRVDHNSQVCQFLGANLADTVISLIESFIYLIIMFCISPVLACVVLAGVIVQAIIIKKISTVLKNLSIRQNRDMGRTYGVLLSGLSISDSLKASGGEDYYMSRLLGGYAKVANSNQTIFRKQQFISAFPKGSIVIINICIILIGSFFVIEGSFTVGSLIAFSGMLAQFQIPIQSLSNFLSMLQMIRADLNFVQDVNNQKEEDVYEFETALDSEGRIEGIVDLKNINFGYNKNENAFIKDFNLHLNKGESVALVGSSGCGKSTIAKIITGLNKPWSGEVLFDNVLKEKYSNECIHLNVATISQNINIFKGTIKENLTLWNNQIPDENIINAAKDACIHDTITKKQGGYSFNIDNGSAAFSGGELQRLEIARALVLNPSVLILDEATSALDPVIEKKVLDNIKKRGCTCIIVAHRLSAIRDCNEIIVIDNGNVIERGTHEELMKNGQEYKNLVNKA